ncbi:protein RRNAD1-like isoform X2 [Dendronephthya gigantea]|uniref:protein RRNAD1-like isoform X2 n=1 Tax=Dendronephthya gigantea TaxID=151771 RepID=UPI00106AA294|nr:protein RRNAD1-like isoform X2 [Dendronephthya gigantea]
MYLNVWPLELLAFLTTCYALKLENQKYLKIINQVNTPEKSNSPRECTKSKTFEREPCDTNRNCNIQKVSDSGVMQQKVEHFSDPFRRHIKPKKQYEINVLSKVIWEQTERLQCWNIVDVGAGLGHLSRLLSYGYKLRVVTIEGVGCHKNNAEKIDEKVLKKLQKQESAEKAVETVDKPLVHITHHINADISTEKFAKIVSDAFSKMESDETSKQLNSQKMFASSENFIIVGLHTCGDLAPTLLRVFTQCQSAVGLISVGCCYMKLSHEKSTRDQTTPTLRGNKFNMINSTNTDSIRTGDKESTIQNEVDLTGAHVDHIPSEVFGRSQEDAFVKVLGYPMSHCVKGFLNHKQTYNALESACHAIDRYHKKLLEISPTLKLHSYRALLELLLKQKRPDCPRRQIRTLRTKKAVNMSFFEYVTKACDILEIDEDRPSREEIHVVEELHGRKQFNVVVFYVLRLLMAPVVEGLVLVDRLIYIKEKLPEINARIFRLFDPDISPRNLAIIAEKQ